MKDGALSQLCGNASPEFSKMKGRFEEKGEVRGEGIVEMDIHLNSSVEKKNLTRLVTHNTKNVNKKSLQRQRPLM